MAEDRGQWAAGGIGGDEEVECRRYAVRGATIVEGGYAEGAGAGGLGL